MDYYERFLIPVKKRALEFNKTRSSDQIKRRCNLLYKLKSVQLLEIMHILIDEKYLKANDFHNVFDEDMIDICLRAHDYDMLSFLIKLEKFPFSSNIFKYVVENNRFDLLASKIINEFWDPEYARKQIRETFYPLLHMKLCLNYIDVRLPTCLLKHISKFLV